MTRRAPEWFGGGTGAVQGSEGPTSKSPRQSSSRSGRSRKGKDGGSSSGKSHRRRKSKDDSSNASDTRAANKEQQQQSQKQGGSKSTTVMSPDAESPSYSQKNKSSIKSKGENQKRKPKLANHQPSQTGDRIPQALAERQQPLNSVAKNLAQRVIGGFQRLASPHQSTLVSPSRKEKEPLNNPVSVTTDLGAESKRMPTNSVTNNTQLKPAIREQEQEQRGPRAPTTNEGNNKEDPSSIPNGKKYPTQQYSSTLPLQDIRLSSCPGISFKPNNNRSKHSVENDDQLTYSDDELTNPVRPTVSISSYQLPQSLHGMNNSPSRDRPNTHQYHSPYEPLNNHDTYQIRRQDEIILAARSRRKSTHHHDPQSSAHTSSYGSISGNDMYLSDSSNDMLPDSHLKKNKYLNAQIPGMILEEDGPQVLTSESDADDNIMSCTISHDPGDNSDPNHDWDLSRQSLRLLDNCIPPHGRGNPSEETSHGSGKLIPNYNSNTSASSEGSHNGAPPVSTLLIHSSNQPQQPPPLPTVLFTTNSPRTSNYSVPSNETLELSLRRARNKKDRRQQRKRKLQRENYERIEDRVQTIVREGHFDDLDWSRHVPQKIGSLNRAAGFFPQEKKFKTAKDRPFALLFLLQLCAITYIAVKYGGLTVMSIVSSTDTEITSQASTLISRNDPFAAQPENDPFSTSTPINDPFSSTAGKDPFSKPETQDPFSTAGIPAGASSTKSFWTTTKNIQVKYNSAFNLACIAALQAISLALLVVMIMMILNNALIQTCLLANIIATLLFSVIGIAVSRYNIIPVLGLIWFALSSIYCIVVWDKVPFATANLNIALSGMKCTADVLLVAFLMMLVAFVWSLVWAVSFLGVYDVFLSTEGAHSDKSGVSCLGLAVYFGMFFSYIWTHNVIQNIVHVTVAGVVGTWWSNPGILKSCCTSSLREQFGKATTTSFGSICLGSLLSPPAFVLRSLAIICTISSFNTVTHNIISSDSSSTGKIESVSLPDDTSPLDSVPSTKAPFDRILNNCSDFGFTYVGIYGESYMTGSRKATDVFRERGWLTVVSDQLIPNILMIATILIALVTGIFTLIVEEFDGYQLTNYQGSAGSTAFLIGCCIGVVLSNICLKVVGSSVSTILVCFSVAPFAFRHHHPGLSGEMRHAWGVTWLDDFQPPEQLV